MPGLIGLSGSELENARRAMHPGPGKHTQNCASSSGGFTAPLASAGHPVQSLLCVMALTGASCISLAPGPGRLCGNSSCSLFHGPLRSRVPALLQRHLSWGHFWLCPASHSHLARVPLGCPSPSLFLNSGPFIVKLPHSIFPLLFSPGPAACSLQTSPPHITSSTQWGL